MRTALAQRIRTLRRVRDWTQEELSSKIGVNQYRMSRLENGSTPKPEEISALAAAFGITTDSLLNETNITIDSQFQNPKGDDQN